MRASVDVVLGDGCYTLLVGSRSYGVLSREVSRVFRPDGRFIMRFFVRPERPESLADILNDLRHGRIGNFHVFKWRLAMALHRSFASGVAVADVWKAWKATGINTDTLVRDLGWSRSAIDTMDVYRASGFCNLICVTGHSPIYQRRTHYGQRSQHCE